MNNAIHQENIFKAPAEQVYAGLTVDERFAKLSGAPAKISNEPGGAFSIFGGAILGRNIELQPNKRIVQAWRVANWADGVYSIVKFDLEQVGSETRLTFDHWGFPEDQREHLSAGWHERYWNPLGKYLASQT